MAVLRIAAYRTLNYSGISGTYAVLGAAIEHNWRAFCITNNTDADLAFSLDGTTNNIFIPAFSFRLYDISTNSPPISPIDNLVIGINTQFYVKYITAPTEGDVYLEGLYAKGE